MEVGWVLFRDCSRWWEGVADRGYDIVLFLFFSLATALDLWTSSRGIGMKSRWPSASAPIGPRKRSRERLGICKVIHGGWRVRLSGVFVCGFVEEESGLWFVLPGGREAVDMGCYMVLSIFRISALERKAYGLVWRGARMGRTYSKRLAGRLNPIGRSSSEFRFLDALRFLANCFGTRVLAGIRMARWIIRASGVSGQN